jgi:hypothetical protein
MQTRRNRGEMECMCTVVGVADGAVDVELIDDEIRVGLVPE